MTKFKYYKCKECDKRCRVAAFAMTAAKRLCAKCLDKLHPLRMIGKGRSVIERGVIVEGEVSND